MKNKIKIERENDTVGYISNKIKQRPVVVDHGQASVVELKIECCW